MKQEELEKLSPKDLSMVVQAKLNKSALKGRFGMFTNKGNRAVKRIVKSSKDYREAYKKLEKLTKIHGEATDTMVREIVLAYYLTKKTLN